MSPLYRGNGGLHPAKTDYTAMIYCLSLLFLYIGNGGLRVSARVPSAKKKLCGGVWYFAISESRLLGHQIKLF